MKGTGPKPLSGSVRVDAQPGSSMVSKGSPSSKENSGPGMFAGIPVASLKHSLKNRQPKLGSPGNEHSRNTKGSPDIMRHEQALKLLQSKMPNFTHRPMPSDLQSAQDRHTGLIFSQPGAPIGRALGKKASTSPSPGPGSPGGRDTSANRSFTDNGSPKPGSPPKKVSYQTSKVGPGSPKQTPGSPSIHSSGGSTSGMRTLSGSPETAGPEYLLNPHKHKNQVVQLNGTPITLFCINHPSTRSQYYVHEDEEVVKVAGSESFLRGVCYKCAVKLAYYRFHAVEIQNPDEGEVKRYLRDLLDRLSESREFHTRALDYFKERATKLQGFYDENSDRLSEFENYIEKWMMILHNHKKQLRDLIVKDSLERMQEMKFVCDQTEERLMHIKSLQAEISQGIEVISIGSRLEDIKRSLMSYENQLVSFKNDVWQQARTPIYVCKFESVPAQQIGELITYMSDWFKLEKQEWTLEGSTGVPAPQADPIPPPIPIDEESARKSNQEDANKANASQFYISFDTKDVFDSALANESGIGGNNPHNRSVQQGKTTNSGVVVNGQEAKAGTNSKEQEIISKLDKINRSQNEKTSFYNSYVGKESSNQLLKDEGGDRGEPLFFTAPADKNFEEKQTPELGQKEEMPQFLKEQYERLMLQQPPMLKSVKPTHVESLASDGNGSGMKGSPAIQGSRSKSDSMQQSEIEDYMSNYLAGNYHGSAGGLSGKDKTGGGSTIGGSGLTGIPGGNSLFSNGSAGSPQNMEGGQGSVGLGPAKCQKILFNDKR